MRGGICELPSVAGIHAKQRELDGVRQNAQKTESGCARLAEPRGGVRGGERENRADSSCAKHEASARVGHSCERARASREQRVICSRASEDAAHGVADEKERRRGRGAASVLPLQRGYHGDQEAALAVQNSAVEYRELLLEVESEPVQQDSRARSLCCARGQRADLERPSESKGAGSSAQARTCV